MSNDGSGIVVSRIVPAGAYVFTASVSASASSSEEEELPTLSCYLKANGTTLSTAMETPANEWFAYDIFTGHASLALSGAAQSGAALTAVVECRQHDADSVRFTGNLTLIKVGSLG